MAYMHARNVDIPSPVFPCVTYMYMYVYIYSTKVWLSYNKCTHLQVSSAYKVIVELLHLSFAHSR